MVAVGLPSGVSADTGLTGPSLHADVTVALGMPTAGLFEPIVAPYAGELVVADVGIPHEVWHEAGVVVPAELLGLSFSITAAACSSVVTAWES